MSRRCGPRRDLEAVELATLKWIDWPDGRRLLEPSGPVPPAEWEAPYYERAEESAVGGPTKTIESPGIPGRFIMFTVDRPRIHSSKPTPEANSQIAGGTGTVLTVTDHWSSVFQHFFAQQRASEKNAIY